jgi:hypothetical protein
MTHAPAVEKHRAATSVMHLCMLSETVRAPLWHGQPLTLVAGRSRVSLGSWSARGKTTCCARRWHRVRPLFALRIYALCNPCISAARKKLTSKKSEEQLTHLFRQLMQELQTASTLEAKYDLAEELASACERSCVSWEQQTPMGNKR